MADDDKPAPISTQDGLFLPLMPASERLARDEVYASIKRMVQESGVRLPRPPLGSFLSQRWATQKVPTGLDAEVAPPYSESSKRFWPGGEEPMRATRETEKFWSTSRPALQNIPPPLTIEERRRRDELRRSAKLPSFAPDFGGAPQRGTVSEVLQRTADLALTLQPDAPYDAEMTVVTLKARSGGEPDANGNVFPSLDGLTFAVPKAVLDEMLRERLPAGVSMSYRSERSGAFDSSPDRADAMAAAVVVPPQTPERIESFEEFTARFGELKRKPAVPPSMLEDRVLGITRVAVPKTAPAKRRHHPRRGYSYDALFGSWAPKILARLRRLLPEEAQFFWPPSAAGQQYLTERLWSERAAVEAARPFLFGDAKSASKSEARRPLDPAARRLGRRATFVVGDLSFAEANAAVRDLRDMPADKLAARAPGGSALLPKLVEGARAELVRKRG